jgi:hypothetical protein
MELNETQHSTQPYEADRSISAICARQHEQPNAEYSVLALRKTTQIHFIDIATYADIELSIGLSYPPNRSLQHITSPQS